VRVEATDAGKALWRTAVDIQAAKEKMFAKPLTPEEKELLNSLLRKMMLSLERSPVT
jgi:DNA-binding MarR family transcriptional regulator